jgi:hypothetical protein
MLRQVAELSGQRMYSIQKLLDSIKAQGIDLDRVR